MQHTCLLKSGCLDSDAEDKFKQFESILIARQGMKFKTGTQQEFLFKCLAVMMLIKMLLSLMLMKLMIELMMEESDPEEIDEME